MLNRVRSKKDAYRKAPQAEGLQFIAEKLNYIESKAVVTVLDGGKGGVKRTYDAPLGSWALLPYIIEPMYGLGSRLDMSPAVSEVSEEDRWKVTTGLFNQISLRHPLSLKTTIGEEGVRPEHNPANEGQLALWYLWRYYFHDKGWKRLKRCPVCLKWFVDETKGLRKTWCSSSCKSKWWSRDRRRDAGHRPRLPQVKERAKKGG